MDRELDEAPAGYLSFDDSGVIGAVNTTLSRMLGYAREDLVGSHISVLLPNAGRIFYNTHVFPMLKLHGRVDEIYLALRGHDDTEVAVLLNGVRRDRDGESLNEAIVVPMRERHDFERELIRARRAAEDASEARERFLSVISHELRSPLTAIVGFTELLQRGTRGPLTERQATAVKKISDAAGYMSSLIDDILGYAGLHRGDALVQAATVPVAEAVERAESLLREQARSADVSLEVRPISAELLVEADRSRLQQILLNLLTNAVKFTPSRGVVTIDAARDSEHDVAILVRDTGPGIAPDRLEAIFEPFVQEPGVPLSRGTRGVGLGLAISRDLARAMGGDLVAESEPGHGSVFVLHLPAG